MKALKTQRLFLFFRRHQFLQCRSCDVDPLSYHDPFCKRGH
nr:MAG TPA: Mss4 protein [Caudoviricetes sp.]